MGEEAQSAACMIRSTVGEAGARRLAIAATIVAGSQLGHAIGYFARFGLAAGGHQATGVHAYFPGLIGLLSALVGGVLMACLVLVAAARLLGGLAPGRRARRQLRFFDLLPALFVCQLVVFAGQELIESIAAGDPLPSAIELLLWGGVGQLPAACIAAGALGWLTARIETAWTVLVAGATRVFSEPVAPAAIGLPAPPQERVRESIFPSAFPTRGPPRLLSQAA